MKQEDWKMCVYYCDKVLEIKPQDPKALYRRCYAYLKLREVEIILIDS
jgi:regulator of sirC expression with transglutaminase-like and TPR domain